MIWIILSTIFCSILLIAVVIIILIRQPELNGKELVKVTETTETGFMGISCYLLCYALLIIKCIEPETGGVDLSSYKLVATFALISRSVGLKYYYFPMLRK